MALESVAIALIAVIPVYSALVALLVLAGLANAVYHPTDYAIMSASVATERMGRAFSIHTFAGYLGAALAPVTMIMLMSNINVQQRPKPSDHFNNIIPINKLVSNFVTSQ